MLTFSAPETGGARKPRPIFERELAFEARLEALAAGDPPTDEAGRYAARHVRSAIERHIATELLGHLPVERAAALVPHPCDDPTPAGAPVAPGAATTAAGTGAPFDAAIDDERRVALARAVVEARVRGAAALREAAEAEGLDADEVTALMRREARAARYLDLMVAPLLALSEVELRELHRSTANPFRGRPFEATRCELRRWVIGQRVGAGIQTFWQGARPRVAIRRARGS